MKTDSSINGWQTKVNPVNLPKQETNFFKTANSVETLQPNTNRLQENNFAGLYLKNKLLNYSGNKTFPAVQNISTDSLSAVTKIQNLTEPTAVTTTLNLEESKSVSDIAYGGKAGEVYQFPDGSTWRVDRADSSFSGFKAVEMHKAIPDGAGGYKDDPKDNRVVVGFAGTNNINDIDDDIDQALGMTPEQYNQALAFTNEVQQEAAKNGEIVNLTGHSLGGGLATYVSIQTGLSATGINSAPLSNGKVPDDVNFDNRITQFYVEGEILTDIDNRNPFDARPGKHVEINGVINEEEFIDSIPLWEKIFTNNASIYSIAISVEDHMLANAAPDIAAPVKVSS